MPLPIDPVHDDEGIPLAPLSGGAFALRLVALLCASPLLACLLPAGDARAAMQNWVAQGRIDARGGAVFAGDCLPSAQVGTSFRIDYRFDDAASDLIPGSTTRGAYPAITSWRLAFSDVNDAATGNNGGVDVWNDDPISTDFADKYEVTFLNLQSWPSPCAATATDLKLTLYEEAAASPIATTSKAQPTAPPTPGDFTTSNVLELDADGSVLTMTISSLDVLGSLTAPVLPYATTTLGNGAERWHFDTTCTTACWVDPPVADGFVYEASAGTRFTSIDDFPTGFGAPFDVWAEGSFVGTFGPGDAVDFSTHPNGGVTHFSVRGIAPGVDVEDVRGFPLRLSLDSSPAQFTMTALGSTPVPVLPRAGGLLLVAALAGVGALAGGARRAP